MRTARRADRGDQHAALARAGHERRGVVSRNDDDVGVHGLRVQTARLGEQPGVRVVVGQPVDVVVEGVQPGGGQDADLPHPAAHPLAAYPRLGDGVGGADHQRADRARRGPWTGTRRSRRRRRRTPRAGRRSRRGRSRSGRRRGGRRCRRRSAHARSASRSSSGSTAPPAKLWVFSTETAAVRTKNGPMSGAYIDSIAARSIWPRGSRQVRMVSPVSAPWAPSSARAMCADASHSTSCPACDERRHGQHVGHRAGRA